MFLIPQHVKFYVKLLYLIALSLYLVAPLIDSISDDQIYQRDQDVTLNCSALGGPDVFIQWQVNSSNLDGENSSTLILPSVNASTGGEYTCVVSNSAGNEEIREGLDFVSSGELVFVPLVFGDEGSYFCNVSSQGQSLQSQSVTLSGKKYITAS